MSGVDELKSVELVEIKKDEEVKINGDTAAAASDDKHTGEYTLTEHRLDPPALEKAMKTDFNVGLTSQEAQMRLARDGPNALTPPPRPNLCMRFMHHLVGGFSSLLWIGSILCFVVYGIDGTIENLTLGIVLAVVVTLTAIFAFYQELKSEKVLAGFLKLVETTALVKRNGEWTEVNARDIVKGDICKIVIGKKVPADVVILHSEGVKVNNSSLTGENEAQKRSPGSSDDNPMRSKNLCFFGTDCDAGNGYGVVVRTGDGSAIGEIASGTINTETPDTLMKKELEDFVVIISIIACTIGIVFLVTSIAMGYKPLQAFVFTIGIIVANVPEGLLATVTLALTITATNMAAKQVLVKNVEVVETLGSVTHICSDKTGTLTQNRMTVRNAIFNTNVVQAVEHGRNFSTTKKGGADEGNDGYQAGFHPVGNEGKVMLSRTKGDFESLPADLQALVTVAGLCNHATFLPPEKGDSERIPILQRKCNGDASESALLKFAHSHTNVDELRKEQKEVACVPFNSAWKWMATIHADKKNGKFNGYWLFVKGAPERVMDRCSTTASGPMTAQVKEDIALANQIVAENGNRVLAFARLHLDLKEGFEFETDDIDKLNFASTDLEFVGLLALEDPARDEVPAAVKSCHEAGITVIMVTGDHPLTARSIAAQVNILRDGKSPIYDTSLPKELRMHPDNIGVVVTGQELEKFDDEDWAYVLSRKDIVFARTLPHQKKDIVDHIQKVKDEEGNCNNVVAVTGDGVNDAPALKKANVGIAMGGPGASEVAKDAADLILMDDNFASIVNGIEEGRLIFANLKKSIAYTLTSNIPEILPFLCQIALKLPLGMTTIMILCIDLGTDMAPAIAFAYEFPESDLMKLKPRDRYKDKLVTSTLISFSYMQIGIIQALASYTCFFEVFKRYNFSASSVLAGQWGFDWSEDKGLCHIKDDTGACVEVAQRKLILQEAQTAFLACIVICQIGCGIACKTRLVSLFSQGMYNMVQNYAIFQEVLLILLLVYVPFLQDAFGTRDLVGTDWAIGIPFSIAIILYDEIRKYFLRDSGATEEGRKGCFYQYFYF